MYTAHLVHLQIEKSYRMSYDPYATCYGREAIKTYKGMVSIGLSSYLNFSVI